MRKPLTKLHLPAGYEPPSQYEPIEVADLPKFIVDSSNGFYTDNHLGLSIVDSNISTSVVNGKLVYTVTVTFSGTPDLSKVLPNNKVVVKSGPLFNERSFFEVKTVDDANDQISFDVPAFIGEAFETIDSGTVDIYGFVGAIAMLVTQEATFSTQVEARKQGGSAPSTSSENILKMGFYTEVTVSAGVVELYLYSE